MNFEHPTCRGKSITLEFCAFALAGRNTLHQSTQGVALGYLLLPLWGVSIQGIH